jgi:gentisate 1,2-dioxygenase
MKLKLTDGNPFEVGGVKGYAVTSALCIKSGDVASLKIDGRHGRVKTTLSDRFYYVIAGAGNFEVGDKNLEVECGDLVVVPKDTPYDFAGCMELLMFCSPAFDLANEYFLRNSD